jgi:hypothetical protein
VIPYWKRIQEYLNAGHPCVLTVNPRDQGSFPPKPLAHDFPDSYKWMAHDCGETTQGILTELQRAHTVCADFAAVEQLKSSSRESQEPDWPAFVARPRPCAMGMAPFEHYHYSRRRPSGRSV